MAVSRRRFMASAASLPALAPALGWAEAGAPDMIAAAQVAEGYRLVGLRGDGSLTFDLELPDRGHAAAAHPERAEIVAFARRPGTFALVVDCVSGTLRARLDAPLGHHFYGHGVFSPDGALLFTTENAYETGAGRLGVWDAASGYKRIGVISSGGIGPHDVVLLPDGQTLAVANGGIRTHPASGREKLNLSSMRPNLAYLRLRDGGLIEQVELPDDLQENSIRHLAVAPDGLIALALQWQGDSADGVPLLAFHRQGDGSVRLADAPVHSLAAMQGYAGSVAFDRHGVRAAITSPRGGRVMAWNIDGGTPDIWARPDVCGLAPGPRGWIATDGFGGVFSLGPDLTPARLRRHSLAFDNHLVGIREFA
ncbi:MAG: DUF1513 domain-containing protein [Pseudomonadota bacterium]